MKQTVCILTALTMALLLVSGFIVAGSAQQTQLIVQKDELLSALTRKNEALTLQLQKADNIREDLEASLTQAKEAAALSGQALAQAEQDRSALVQERTQLETALANANQECARLSEQVDALRVSLTQTQEDAAQAALLSEQKAQEDAQAIAALKQQNETLREKLLTPPAAPTLAPYITP